MDLTLADPISVEKATLYEKHRLPYAAEVVPDLLDRIGEVDAVADVGAGTGQVARLLACGSRTVYAVEPDPSMRQVGRAALDDLSGIEFVDGSAEATTLPGSCVDLIVIGNAFHRFKPSACEELRRILRSGGWIALFSYRFLDSAFTDLLFSKLTTLESWASRSERAQHRMPTEMLFGEGATDTLSYPQSLIEGWEAFFGAARAGIEAPERDDRDFQRFEQINREVFDAFSTDGEMEIRYETTVTFGQSRV